MKRLEALLTKCKESIKANKQKTQALTEVKESLSAQLSDREGECEKLRTQVRDYEAWKAKAQEEELQIAETKMVMHQVRVHSERTMPATKGAERSRFAKRS